MAKYIITLRNDEFESVTFNFDCFDCFRRKYQLIAGAYRWSEDIDLFNFVKGSSSSIHVYITECPNSLKDIVYVIR